MVADNASLMAEPMSKLPMNIPVITAAGIIKAVLSLLVVFKVVAVDDVNDQVLNFIGDTEFYFSPVFLGASAAR